MLDEHRRALLVLLHGIDGDVVLHTGLQVTEGDGVGRFRKVELRATALD